MMINNYNKYKIVTLLIVLSLIILTAISYGNESKYRTVGENQIVEGDFIALSTSGENYGKVIGDFIVIGDEAKNDGLIEGDILAMTSELTSRGMVKGDIRGFASQVNIEGEVNRNASILANHIIFNDGSVIDGSVHALANTMKLYGFVGGDIRGTVNTLEIHGTIKGNVYIHVKNIEFDSGGKIEGDLVYISEDELDIPKEYIGGTIEHNYPTNSSLPYQLNLLGQQLKRFLLLFRVLFLISYLIVGSILIRLFKKPTERAAANIEKSPILGLGIGLALLVVVPIVAILLMATVIGIPIGGMIFVFYFILIYLSRIPVGLWLGQKIFKDSPHPILAFILGSILISAASLIPVVGKLLSFVVLIIGMGISVIMIKGYYKKEYEEEEGSE
ncbi:bactofilin family protein [Alkaliphilus serpentinus]|uniref:Polymer-forming cytoskeletal protein n=1 Tax=Alkaliphilus serpentinus TaxID=1482731 RepID=A0A833HQL8_9FIRM|nr:polymer-forming cytoskeletal protein [Alkaliphilus serpentinus]KAB3532074.1 polymer-forming cytoskeletal protein [Alkaliphilus serpentinus]